jgi:hypothetical protein
MLPLGVAAEVEVQGATSEHGFSFGGRKEGTLSGAAHPQAQKHMVGLLLLSLNQGLRSHPGHKNASNITTTTLPLHQHTVHQHTKHTLWLMAAAAKQKRPSAECGVGE